MQPQKFKPGDLVRVLGHPYTPVDYGGDGPPPIGCVGTVVGYFDEAGVCVEWRNYNKGHNGGDKFPSGENKKNRWYLQESYLELAKGVILKQILDETEGI